MTNLKLKCSQMSLSDLDVLKKTILSNYQSEISKCENDEDRAGLIDECESFESAISELILSKSTDIVFSN